MEFKIKFLVFSAVFLVVFLLFSSAKADTTTGLVGWWRFDEGSGTTAIDSSGRGHNGTLVNSPTWVTGKMGSALSFDGVSTYVRIPASTDFDSPNEFTVSAWVYPTNPAVRVTAVGRAMSNLWHLWVLEQVNIGGGAARFDVEYVTRFIYGEPSLRATGSAYSMNTWHHVVGVKTASNTVRIYLDGVAGGESGVSPNPYPSDLSGVDISIGSRRAITPDSVWYGYIDDVQIYNRALTASEITALYNLGSGASDTTPPAAPSGVVIS